MIGGVSLGSGTRVMVEMTWGSNGVSLERDEGANWKYGPCVGAT